MTYHLDHLSASGVVSEVLAGDAYQLFNHAAFLLETAGQLTEEMLASYHVAQAAASDVAMLSWVADAGAALQLSVREKLGA